MKQPRPNRFLYEYRPYIYVAIAVAGFAFTKKSKLAFVSGLTLLICAFVILEMRKRYQEKLAEDTARKRMEDLRKLQRGIIDIKEIK